MANTKKRHRSFTPKAADAEPLSFDLYDETFNCRPSLQGAVVLEFLSASDAEGSAAARQILDFYRHALDEESYARFQILIEDPDRVVDLETLTEILAWLIEEYTSRPTQAS